jgi:hypothetical protein
VSRSYFIAGHARLPQGMVAKNLSDTFTITAEIDKNYGVILEASCTLATEHGRKFIGNLLRGLSLRDGIDEISRIIQEHYHGKAAHALNAALNDLYIQFEQLNKKKN